MTSSRVRRPSGSGVAVPLGDSGVPHKAQVQALGASGSRGDANPGPRAGRQSPDPALGRNAHSVPPALVPLYGGLLLSFIVLGRPRNVKALAVVLAGAVVVGGAGSRWREATTWVVGGLALGAALYGVTRRQRFHPPGWRRAWTGVTAGLTGVVGASSLTVAGLGGLPTHLGLPMALTSAGDLLAVAGLAWLIEQRVAGRAAEALSEAAVVGLALLFVVLTLGVVPADGWRPELELIALTPPMLDIVVLWMVCSLVSLTERHPVSYGYLLAGTGFVLVAHVFYATATLMHEATASGTIETIVLCGGCLWAVSIAHPSLRRPFDPVPLRPSRPGKAKLAMLVALALTVPMVLSIQSAFGTSTRDPALVVGSTLLPLLIVLYLLRQVFTHAAAEYRAQHDPLTGVCNRVLFEDRLRLSLNQADRSGCSVAVMFLDLDRFKGINDSLGHAVGNQLLQAVVKRLQGVPARPGHPGPLRR